MGEAERAFTRGDHIGERYRLEAPLGDGTFATVWRATDLSNSSRSVALKILRQDLAAARATAARFELEARVLSGLAHPAIARAYEFVLGPTCAAIALELIEGQTLLEEMIARGERQAHFSRDEVLSIIDRIADGLGHAHAKGIVHRDLKPGNIVMSLAGLKILDFGVAKVLGAGLTEATTQGRMLGTYAYMSPEQINGQPVDHRTDVFALACMSFELLTLRWTWVRERSGEAAVFAARSISAEGENNYVNFLSRICRGERPRVSDYRSDVPPQVDRVLARGLAIDAAQRPSSARALALELREAVLSATGPSLVDVTEGMMLPSTTPNARSILTDESHHGPTLPVEPASADALSSEPAPPPSVPPSPFDDRTPLAAVNRAPSLGRVELLPLDPPRLPPSLSPRPGLPPAAGPALAETLVAPPPSHSPRPLAVLSPSPGHAPRPLAPKPSKTPSAPGREPPLAADPNESPTPVGSGISLLLNRAVQPAFSGITSDAVAAPSEPPPPVPASHPEPVLPPSIAWVVAGVCGAGLATATVAPELLLFLTAMAVAVALGAVLAIARARLRFNAGRGRAESFFALVRKDGRYGWGAMGTGPEGHVIEGAPLDAPCAGFSLLLPFAPLVGGEYRVGVRFTSAPGPLVAKDLDIHRLLLAMKDSKTRFESPIAVSFVELLARRAPSSVRLTGAVGELSFALRRDAPDQAKEELWFCLIGASLLVQWLRTRT